MHLLYDVACTLVKHLKVRYTVSCAYSIVLCFAHFHLSIVNYLSLNAYIRTYLDQDLQDYFSCIYIIIIINCRHRREKIY